MIKSGMFTSLMLILLVNLAAATMEFAEFQKWLGSMSYEERAEYELSLSANFTEANGEEANTLRLCTSLYKNYSSTDIWVD